MLRVSGMDPPQVDFYPCFFALSTALLQTVFLKIDKLSAQILC